MASATKDGGSWKVRFYDADGNRRQIRLVGINQRQAETIARHVGILNAARIANDANIDRGTALWLQGLGQGLHEKLAAAGLVEARSSSLLGSFLAEYVASRPDTKDSTQRKFTSAVNHLNAFFGESRDLRTITKGDADGFRAFLYRQGHAENTVRRYCGLAKQFFRAALRRKLVEENAFGDQVAAVRGNAAKFHFITREDAAKILRACPDTQWRMIFALARFGGLRCPSEIVGLRWEDVSWQERRLTVRSPKTEHHEGKAERVIPLFPELAAVLEEGFAEAVESIEAGNRKTVGGPVITRYTCSTQNLRTTFLKIVARAGLKPWPKLMQNLRSSRETELAESFPLQAVTAWMGNSQLVAAKHYLQLRDEHFERAAGGNLPEAAAARPADPQADPQTCETGETGRKLKKPEIQKPSLFPSLSLPFASLPKMRMGDEGLEPPPENTGKAGVSKTAGPTGGPKTQEVDLQAIAAAIQALSPESLAALFAAALQPQPAAK